MPRRPATVSQADIARVLRAAKREGATAVSIEMGGAKMNIQLGDVSSVDKSTAKLEKKRRALI